MEIIVGLIAFAIISYLIIIKGIFGALSGPKIGDYFTCSQCGARVKHSQRTISAWKSGLKSSICGNCHSSWIANQRSRSNPIFGCLGLLAVLALIAIAVVMFL